MKGHARHTEEKLHNETTQTQDLEQIKDWIQWITKDSFGPCLYLSLLFKFFREMRVQLINMILLCAPQKCNKTYSAILISAWVSNLLDLHHHHHKCIVVPKNELESNCFHQNEVTVLLWLLCIPCDFIYRHLFFCLKAVFDFTASRQPFPCLGLWPG